MSDTQAMSKEQIGTLIARKAFADEGFRQRVLGDANAVYEQETGEMLPPGVTIKVHEDTATTVNFAIPFTPARAGELSDSDLEAIAGGTDMAVTPATPSIMQGKRKKIW